MRHGPRQIIHPPRCRCGSCQARRSWGDRLAATGNGIAYIVFGLIGQVLLYFLITWGYHEWWVSTHCALVLGTQVCR
jgi:hypothetical protein